MEAILVGIHFVYTAQKPFSTLYLIQFTLWVIVVLILEVCVK